MHEYSIVESLLGRVEESIRAYDVSAITCIRIKIGALSGVDPGLLRTAFDLCVPGTRFTGARLDIEHVPARWRCARCERDMPEGQRLACGSCGGSVRLVEGDEILLDKIDLEVRDV